MPPKTPKQLREEIDSQQEQPAQKTSKGYEISVPKKWDFLRDLEKVSKPED